MVVSPLDQFFSTGTSCPARAAMPLILHGEALWQVAHGPLDVFLCRFREGQPVGALHPLCRVESGGLIWGLPEELPHEWRLVAAGGPESRIQRRIRGDFAELLNAQPALAGVLDAALEGWMRHLAGPLDFAQEEGRFSDRLAWPVLDRQLAALLAARIDLALAGDREQQARLLRKSENERGQVQSALQSLAEVLVSPQASSRTAGASLLLAACRMVGKSAGLEFHPPPVGDSESGRRCDPLGEIVDASRLRFRRVALKGEWWRHDNGDLLGYLDEERHPVAVLRRGNGYRLHDPRDGRETPVDGNLAARLGPFGEVFYRSFGEAQVTLAELIRFGNTGNLGDYLAIVLVSVVLASLGLAVPLVTGMLFDTVIPGAQRGDLLQLGMALLAAAFATAMFELSRGYAVLRVESKIDMAVQAAVWDRLLRLPVPFFRNYTAGDLAMRVGGIDTIRTTIAGNTLHSLLGAAFSVFYLVLLFYYSTKLALLALALVAVAVVFTAGTGYFHLRYERQRSATEGRVSGLVFQLLSGIAKLRIAGAEGRAFRNWAVLYARQQEESYRGHMVRGVLEVFSTVFPIVANMAIFAVIAFYLGAERNISTGDFLAFNAAFGAFLVAMLGAAGALIEVLEVVPLYERGRPVLQGTPEICAARVPPGLLKGEIEVSQVSFRYTPDGPLVLDGVSLHVKAGEFVALVGASGSGKSTLLRLLLAFETPLSGSAYYDHQDLAGLDPGALRRQLGVVLQNGQLLAGDIYTNIVGATATLTLDDAWAAAEQAGIAADIRDMPMGMYTIVGDGGGGLSGGQRQRLLIARALVNRPRIVFFDEATSALDNRVQEVVSSSLEKLRATRIVIAHRLSTIKNADRIFVLDGGKVVQSGTYAELIGCEGPFAELAQRQIV